MDHGQPGGVVAEPAGGACGEHHRSQERQRVHSLAEPPSPVSVTLNAAWAATEQARRMCIKATHDHPVPFAPCIPHVIEAARAAFQP